MCGVRWPHKFTIFPLHIRRRMGPSACLKIFFFIIIFIPSFFIVFPMLLRLDGPFCSHYFFFPICIASPSFRACQPPAPFPAKFLTDLLGSSGLSQTVGRRVPSFHTNPPCVVTLYRPTWYCLFTVLFPWFIHNFTNTLLYTLLYT